MRGKPEADLPRQPFATAAETTAVTGDPAAEPPIELCGVRLPAEWPDDEFNALLPFVSPERREQIGRFRRREDRMRSLIAELLARWMLARRLRIAPGEIRFVRNRYGKPLCTSGPVHFNLSHSGDWVVAAVSRGEIGVDVERIDPAMDLSLAAGLFTPAELAWMDQDGDGKRERFFELWTYKESFIKCAGTGLSVPLNSFSVMPRADGTATVVPVADGMEPVPPAASGPYEPPEPAIPADCRNYRLKQFPLDGGHRLAVCSLGWPPDGVAFRELPFRTLISAFAP